MSCVAEMRMKKERKKSQEIKKDLSIYIYVCAVFI
jgi:hypothetical protein